jgi:hypothetical protein
VQKKYTYFIPLFNKISLLWGQQPGGDEASSNEGGKTQAQLGMTLQTTYFIGSCLSRQGYFLCLDLL